MPEKMTMRQARIKRNLTIEQAAQLLGVTSGTVWNYEMGRTEPPVSMVQKMLSVYNAEFDGMQFTKDKDQENT